MNDSGCPSSLCEYSKNIYPGKLKKILLKNFMCHDYFEIDLNPCLNFITGRNGSGKSAIATALVLGFGQRASCTNRGVAVKGFIKQGRQVATIEITLYNYGNDNAYKPADYGNEITVTRTISDNGCSVYKIKGQTGNEERLTHHDLDSLLLHFNIQSRNPLCILNQDTARSFFKSCNPKDMYSLFMQGTQLESVKDAYQKNKDSLLRLTKENKKNAEELKKIYSDIIEAEELQKIVDKLRSAEAAKVALENEHNWALLKHCEAISEKNLRKLELAVEENRVLMSGQDDSAEKEENTLISKKKLEEDLIKLQRDIETLEIQLKSATDNMLKQQEELRSKKQDVEYYKSKITTEDANIATLQKEIEKIRSLNSKVQEHKQQIDLLTGKIEETEAIIKTSETHNAQLKDTLDEYEQQLANVNVELRKHSLQVEEAEHSLRQVREGKHFGVYGHWMPGLIERIENAHQRGMFKEKPRGPLGSYIKVLDSKWVPAVETILKSLLFSFCVTCVEDNKVLSDFIDNTVRSGRKPDIIIGKFIHKVHDTSQYEVITNKYRSLLRNIRITDPVVANCLIDQLAIEQILMVPGIDEVLKIMENEHNVPRNCKFAFTLDADYVYPAPNYRFYAGNVKGAKILEMDSSQQIRKLEENLKSSKSEVEKLELAKGKILNNLREVQIDYQESCRTIKKLLNKKRMLTDEKYELEKNVQFEPNSIDLYNQEISDIENRKKDASEKTVMLENEVDMLNNKIIEFRKKENNLKIEKTNLNKKLHSVNEEILNHKNYLKKSHQNKAELKKQANDRKHHIKELQKKLNESNEECNRLKLKTNNDNIGKPGTERKKIKIIQRLEEENKQVYVYRNFNLASAVGTIWNYKENLFKVSPKKFGNHK
ncbi:structural maintenance of chromosomes 6 isoform X2 [Lycorma delicatula]|uniref:structural maintenance of chromosomes 6 isoform X2 n=1 Tax=Lycorma delicatula TaxID=130591 RepID=UPI003F519A0D